MKIIVNHVLKIFEQQQASLTVLNNINIIFEQGRSYAIKGASGTGKSTLLHILAGLDCPTAGNIQYELGPVLISAQQELLSKHIGLVFQVPYLIQELSVLENVMLKGLIAGGASADYAKVASQLLEQVDLTQKAYEMPAKLSGGQQQRVALARAVFNSPSFLLGDEITGNLDIATGMRIIGFIKDIQAKEKMGIILTTHDEYVAAQMDHVLELVDGQLRIIR